MSSMKFGLICLCVVFVLEICAAEGESGNVASTLLPSHSFYPPSLTNNGTNNGTHNGTKPTKTSSKTSLKSSSTQSKTSGVTIFTNIMTTLTSQTVNETAIHSINVTVTPNVTVSVTMNFTGISILSYTPSNSPPVPPTSPGPTHPAPTKSAGKSDEDYDSMKKRMWIASSFAIIFAITTLALGYLVYRQRKINRDLEGDPASSRLL